MLIVIAGGVGVGKSAVTNILKEKGGTILSADEINRELLETPDYIKKIQAFFPFAVENGKVNKKALRERIFESEEERLKLNALSHPLIFAELKKRAEKIDGAVFAEVPLLMECGWSAMFDRIWAVTAPIEERLKRIVLRDGISETLAKAMIASQSEEEHILEIADEIIMNSGGVENLTEQVGELYEKLLKKE